MVLINGVSVAVRMDSTVLFSDVIEFSDKIINTP